MSKNSSIFNIISNSINTLEIVSSSCRIDRNNLLIITIRDSNQEIIVRQPIIPNQSKIILNILLSQNLMITPTILTLIIISTPIIISTLIIILVMFSSYHSITKIRMSGVVGIIVISSSVVFSSIPPIQKNIVIMSKVFQKSRSSYNSLTRRKVVLI